MTISKPRLTTTLFVRAASVLGVVAILAGLGSGAQAAGILNLAVANITTMDANGSINSTPRDVNIWLTNVDSGASVKLGLNSGNQWLLGQQPNGRYRLSITSAGKYPTVWWPGTYTREAAGVIILNESAGTNCSGKLTTTGCAVVTWNWQVNAARNVGGRVIERWGSGAPGQVVSAVRQDDPFARYSATTDSGGYYSMSVPPGKYQFSVPNGNTAASSSVDIKSAGQSVNLTRSAVPSPPINVVATASSRKVSVAWSSPQDNGGQEVTEYRATAQPGGQSCTSGQAGCVIDGVPNNVGYTVTVTAVNAVGVSAPSAPSGVVVPLDPAPSAPRDVRAVAASKQAKVSWTQPAIGADTITGYRVTSSPGGFTCSTKELSCTVTGLTNGTDYTFRVTASSTGGESAASEPSGSVTPATVPAAPRDVVATAGDRALGVSWTPPEDNGGAPITGFTATAMPGGRQCTTSAAVRQCSITGLTRRPYTVTVTATNRIGASSPSAPSNEVTPLDAVPAAPNGISAVPGDRQATVSWAAPSAGPEGITGYRVTSSPGGFTCTTRELSCTVAGLVNGTNYTFRVIASSTGGDSAASEPSVAVMPAGVPSAVRGVTAEPGDKTVLVSWLAPLDNGGSPITGYTATAWPTGRVCAADDGQRSCVIAGLTNGQAYSVTVTANNRIGTSERSPGSVPVTPKSSLPDKKIAAVAIRLTKGTAKKGAVKVKWTATGADHVELTWQRVGQASRKKKVVPASGSMVLKGKAGTQYLVGLVATSGAGEKASSSKVYTVSR